MLPAPHHVQRQRGLRHGVADWVTARRALTVTGEPARQPSDDELLADAAADQTIHDLLGKFQITSKVRLYTQDMANLSTILAWWVYRRDVDSREIRFTYRQAYEAQGLSWHGDFVKAFRASLLRLDAFRARLTWQRTDGREEWVTFAIFEKVHGIEGEGGQLRVVLHSEFHRRMRDTEFNLYPLQSYRHLRSDLAKEIYRFIETQRGFGTNGDYEITVIPHLLATLGCRDSHERRARVKLRRACEEIMAVDPRYKDAGLRRGARRGEYVLYFHRQRVITATPVVPAAPADQASARSSIPVAAVATRSGLPA